MTDSSGTAPSSKEDFSGVFIRNQDRITPRKSIVICGITRGGTSFAASAFGNLGVPFTLEPFTGEGVPEISQRYEHHALRAAFRARDGTTIREIAAGFSARHRVWAWKLPSIQRDFNFVAKYVPNPHFVIIFKEPLSVAWRKSALKGRATIHNFVRVLAVYQHMLEFAGKTEHPLMLMSYDWGLSKLEEFLPEIAEFAGVSDFDVLRAIDGIHEDGSLYYLPPKVGEIVGAQIGAREATHGCQPRRRREDQGQAREGRSGFVSDDDGAHSGGARLSTKLDQPTGAARSRER